MRSPALRVCCVALLLPLARAQPVPVADEIGEAQRAFAAARQSEREAHAALERAAAAVRTAEAGLAESAARNRTAYDQLVAAEGAARGQILALYQRRLELAAQPAPLVARERQLRATYDALLPARAHVNDGTFRLLEAELRAVNTALAALHRDLEGRKAALDAEIAALRARADQAARGLLLSEPEPDAFAPLFAAGRAQEEAARALAAAEQRVAAAGRTLVWELGRGSPPFLESIAIGSGRQPLYRARWVRSESGPAALAETAIDSQAAAVRSLIARHDAEIAEMSAELEAARLQRVEIAEKMMPLTRDLQRQADNYGSALVWKVVAQTSGEIVFTTAEIVLTGGTATLARKSAEIVEEKAAALLARKAAATAASEAAEQAVVQAVVREATAAERAAWEAWKSAVKAEHVAAARAAALQAQRPTGAAAHLAAQEADELFRLIEGRAAATAGTAATRALVTEAAAAATKLAPHQMNPASVQAGLAASRAALAGLRSAAAERAGALAGKAAAVPAPSPFESAAGRQFTGDAIEQAVATATGTALSAAVAGHQARGTPWERLKTGRDLIAGRLRPREMLSGVANWKTGTAVVGSMVKACFAQAFENQASIAQLRFWDLYGQLDMHYALILASMAACEPIEAARRAQLRERAELEAALALAATPRRLLVERDEPAVDPTEAISIQLVFSREVAAAPLVTVNGIAAPRAADALHREWSATTWPALLAQGRNEIKVELPGGRSPASRLDGDPATAAWRNLAGSWRGHDERADTRHALQAAVPAAPRAAPPPAPRAPLGELAGMWTYRWVHPKLGVLEGRAAIVADGRIRARRADGGNAFAHWESAFDGGKFSGRTLGPGQFAPFAFSLSADGATLSGLHDEGPATWQRVRPAIDLVRCVPSEALPGWGPIQAAFARARAAPAQGGAGPGVFLWLRGRDLPLSDSEEILHAHFDDPYLTRAYARRQGEWLVVETRLHDGVEPGRKRAVINGTPVEFELAFPDRPSRPAPAR
jgi:hypothetical protein